MTKKLIRLAISMIFMFSLSSSLVYGELKITEIERKDGQISLIFNKSIKINNITIKGNDINFPVYISKGKVYKEFSILKRDFKQYIIDSVKNNSVSDYSASISFEINKFNIIKNHKSVKAAASIIIEGVLEIECRVMQGKNGLWTAFPAQKKNNKWTDDLSFLDYNLKKTVETRLMSRYISNNVKNDEK
jgi:DNA-binding cell septation regulator SpoVG